MCDGEYGEIAPGSRPNTRFANEPNPLRRILGSALAVVGDERRQYVSIFALCLFLSVGGIAICALYPGWPPYGGCGGALAVALALTTAWINLPLGNEYLKLIVDEAPEVWKQVAERMGTAPAAADQTEDRLSSLERRVSALMNARSIDQQGANTAYTWLAAATAIGTLAAGFGSLAALGIRVLLFRQGWVTSAA